jgi:hypothetical protein
MIKDFPVALIFILGTVIEIDSKKRGRAVLTYGANSQLVPVAALISP